METANKLIEIARGELGTKESPAGSNRVKYASWYGMNGQPWCVMFVMWVCHCAGVALPTRTASCTTLMRAAKAADMWVNSGYQPGDIVIYDWSGDGVPDHCGIVESVNNAQITAIEGNTAVGNDSDGGEVMRRTRSVKQILGAVRPLYRTNRWMYSRISKEAVDWMTSSGIMQGDKSGDLRLSDGMTRDEFSAMLYRYHLKFGK